MTGGTYTMGFIFDIIRGAVDTVITGFFLVFMMILFDELTSSRKKSRK